MVQRENGAKRVGTNVVRSARKISGRSRWLASEPLSHYHQRNHHNTNTERNINQRAFEEIPIDVANDNEQMSTEMPSDKQTIRLSTVVGSRSLPNNL